MKVLQEVNKNIETSNEILLDLKKLINKLSKIIMMVNIVNIATIIVLLVVLLK